MATNNTEIRKVRSYKVADSAYTKAIERAKKEKPELATRVEEWVTAYGKGKKIVIQETTTADKIKESKLDSDSFMKYLLKITGGDEVSSKKIHSYIFKAIE